jgi:hypothetical protein
MVPQPPADCPTTMARSGVTDDWVRMQAMVAWVWALN